MQIISSLRKILFLFVLLTGALCLAQSDDDASLSIDSQEIAVEAMLDKARISLQKTDYNEAQKIISGAVEIAKDSALYAKTQLVQPEFYLIHNQSDLALQKLAKIEKLIPENSASQMRLYLLQADLHINNKKYLDADQALNKAKAVTFSNSDSTLSAQLDFLRSKLNLETNNLYEAVNGFREVLPKLEI